ncbi:hypothetical protein OIV83_006275 [Microbotryomycetes sp. JL201]|nr:hypothetical protein OIV83_006275 [Microbotryomycetes sp. JL201]
MDGELEESNVWAASTATSGTSQSSSLSAATEPVSYDGETSSASNAAAGVLSAVAHALPSQDKPYIDDLDPFSAKTDSGAPQSGYNPDYMTTLGSVVNSTARLEILPNSDDSDEGSTSSTSSSRSPLATQPTPASNHIEINRASNETTSKQSDGAETGPETPQKAKPRLHSTATNSSPSTSFLGNMFRSMSGSGSPTPTKHAASGAVASTSKDPAPTESTISEKQGHAEHTASAQATPTSNLPKSFSSIASVFKPSASSHRATSALGSPQLGDKAAVEDSEKSAKGKSRIKDEERESYFDFNRFLEQMRSRSAEPVAKYLRSFLKEFSRRTPRSTEDQVRVINDFLDFIAGKMRAVDPWKSYFTQYEPERAEVEFDMAMEAMEKLVMNRLWHLTFTPALDLSSYPGQVSVTGDLERDQVLSQRIRLFSWIKPIHLDLPISDPEQDEDQSPRSLSPRLELSASSADVSAAIADGESEAGTGERADSVRFDPQKQRQIRGFLDFARRELRKINQYKAPRDKMICVLNCCKVIFGLIRHVSSDEGADTFIPFLIYVVLKTNPEHLVSNIQRRFRNPDKLSGEGGYYLSSLNGAISFIETVDASALSNITKAEFESNVAQAIRDLPVDPDDSPRLGRLEPTEAKTSTASISTKQAAALPAVPSSRSPGVGIERARLSPAPQTGAGVELIAAAAADPESPTPLQQPGMSLPDATKAFLLRSTDSVERMVSKPLNAIGRIFEQFEETVSDLPGGQQVLYGGASSRPGNHSHPLPPLPVDMQTTASPKRRSLQPFVGGAGPQRGPGAERGMYVGDETPASVLSERIDRAHEQQRQAALETLKNVFPSIEAEVLEVVGRLFCGERQRESDTTGGQVLLSNGGDMSKTIDALLEMS